jgi:hypothetical protein
MIGGRNRGKIKISVARLVVLVGSCGTIALFGTGIVKAQDAEPRSYSNTPVGLNFLIAGALYSQGKAPAYRREPAATLPRSALPGSIVGATDIEDAGPGGPTRQTEGARGPDAVPGKPTWLIDIDQRLKDLKRMVKP